MGVRVACAVYPAETSRSCSRASRHSSSRYARSSLPSAHTKTPTTGRTGLVPPLSPSPLAAGASDPVYGVCTTAGAGADRGRAGSTPLQPNHTRPQPDTPGGDAGRASESTTTPFPLCVSHSPGSTCIPCRADGKKELELPCAGAAGGALRTGYHPAGRVDTPASPVHPPPGGQLSMELT